MELVNFVENLKTAFKKFEGVWSTLGRPHPFELFKGCLPQILLSSFLNTITQIFISLTHFGPMFYFYTPGNVRTPKILSKT